MKIPAAYLVLQAATVLGVTGSAVILLSSTPAQAAGWVLSQTFNSPTPAQGDQFGTGVAISDSNVVVGADGSAFLFNATTGSLLQTFTDPTPASVLFGRSVAISGNTVLVGDPDFLGSAYLFNAVTGNILQTFTDSSSSSGGSGFLGFGSTVAISGSKVLVGAADAISGAGIAYLFDATTGNLLQTFNNPTPESGELFGSRLAIDGDNILIGASNANDLLDRAGAAYLFDATTGDLVRTFYKPTPPVEIDFFGRSVAISGNSVLISATRDDTGAIDAGSAYLFDATTGNLQQTFNNPEPADSDRFGGVAALSGDYVLVGSFDDDFGAVDAGSAYLFDATSGNLLQTFNNPEPAQSDRFGIVAISGSNVLVGAFRNDTSVTDAGTVYLFTQPAPPEIGSSPENPYLPSIIDGVFNFDVVIGDPSSLYYFDPDVATGYDYTVSLGPLIDQVIAPALTLDNQYDLYISGDGCQTYGISLGSIIGGTPYNFSTPQACFGIRGIDVAANLDPTNPLAFVTGISFDKSGPLPLRQTPVTEFVSTSASVPGPLPIFGMGAAFSWSRRLRQRARQHLTTAK